MLQLTGVEAGYELLQVLWGVDLHVDEGEFVALLGPNGAGKTTTLRTIAGFLQPIRGSVMFRGAHLDGVSPHRVSTTGVGYVSESLNLFPAMSVYENLLVGAYAVKDKARILSDQAGGVKAEGQGPGKGGVFFYKLLRLSLIEQILHDLLLTPQFRHWTSDLRHPTSNIGN